MGNTSVANCTDSTIAMNSPNMAILEKINTAAFSNNSTYYNASTYDAAILTCNESETKRALRYFRERLDDGEPVLFGAHYTGVSWDPPNNINRATRHYMVIVGRSKSGELEQFRFFDAGRSSNQQAEATSPYNVFHMQSNGCATATYQGRSYTISEVLKTN